jgi:hypothetical protein
MGAAMTPEMLITLTTARTVQRLEIPGTARPYWTVAEAAHACGGLEPEVFAALLYSYAGDDTVVRTLGRALREFGQDLRTLERWPYQVSHEDGARGEYLEDLVTLTLIEERQPWRFGAASAGNNAPAVSPFYLAVAGVTERVWRKRLAVPYAALRWRYITWLGVGRGHMVRSMRHGSTRTAQRAALSA